MNSIYANGQLKQTFYLKSKNFDDIIPRIGDVVYECDGDRLMFEKISIMRNLAYGYDAERIVEIIRQWLYK